MSYSQQELVCNGKKLENNKKVSDYKINNESTVHLICMCREDTDSDSEGRRIREERIREEKENIKSREIKTLSDNDLSNSEEDNKLNFRTKIMRIFETTTSKVVLFLMVITITTISYVFLSYKNGENEFTKDSVA